MRNEKPTEGGNNRLTADSNTPASVERNAANASKAGAAPSAFPTPPKARKAKGTARKGNPEPYARFLKTIPVDVRATESQLGWIKESAIYMRCTPGEFILAAALAFVECGGDCPKETHHAIIGALQSFIFKCQLPSRSPGQLYSYELGRHYTEEEERAANDRELRLLGLPTDSETMGEELR